MAQVERADRALLTDLYQLTMVQAYLREGMTETGVFSLFSRRLGDRRNVMIACGLEDALDYLESARFSGEDLEYLASTEMFSQETLDWLEVFRFSGDVRAMAEGTACFADEPLLEVAAPMPEAQLVETFVLNQVHLGTTLASKALRVVCAASGRKVVDFGLRRMHGADAGLQIARACWIAGVDATSNVLAGRVHGIPISGTMAHSYVEAHDDELASFAAFCEAYPDTVLLVDTYDTLEGVRNVCRLAERLGEDFRVKAVRLDSGDLGELSRQSRRILDEAGLRDVEIFASGGLDEWRLRELVDSGAPIDGFGVGTKMGVSADQPSLDMVYKLAEYAGHPRLKLSTGKSTLPGRKQVWRVGEDTPEMHDVISLEGESIEGRALLEPVMKGGERLEAGREDLSAARSRVQRERQMLPRRLLAIDAADPAYEVRVSEGLEATRGRVSRALAPEGGAPAGAG